MILLIINSINSGIKRLRVNFDKANTSKWHTFLITFLLLSTKIKMFLKKIFQVLGQLHGWRQGRSHEGLQTFRGQGDHPASQGPHAHEDHVQVPQEGQADPPTTHDGGRSHCLQNLGAGTLGSQIPWVSKLTRFCPSIFPCTCFSYICRFTLDLYKLSNAFQSRDHRGATLRRPPWQGTRDRHPPFRQRRDLEGAHARSDGGCRSRSPTREFRCRW